MAGVHQQAVRAAYDRKTSKARGFVHVEFNLIVAYLF